MTRAPMADAAAIGPFMFERARLEEMVEEAERAAAAAEPERDRSKSARKALANSGKRSTSNHKGVNLHARSNRWEAHIWDGHQVHVGCYDTELQAAVAYDLVALRLRGDDAKLNFPTADYTDEIRLLQELTKEQVLMAMRGQALEQRADGSYWVAGVGPATSPLKASSADSEDGARPVRSSRRPPPTVYSGAIVKSPSKTRGRAKAVKRPRSSQTTGPRSPRPASKRFCLPTLTLRTRTPPTPSFSSSDSDTQGSISPEAPLPRLDLQPTPGSIYSASGAVHAHPKSTPKSAPEIKAESSMPDDHLMALCDRLSEPDRSTEAPAPFSPAYPYSQHPSHSYGYHSHPAMGHGSGAPYRPSSPSAFRGGPVPPPHACPCCAALRHSSATPYPPSYQSSHPMEPHTRYGYPDMLAAHHDRYAFSHPYPHPAPRLPHPHHGQPAQQHHPHAAPPHISHHAPSHQTDCGSPTPSDYSLPHPHPVQAYPQAHAATLPAPTAAPHDHAYAPTHADLHPQGPSIHPCRSPYPHYPSATYPTGSHPHSLPSPHPPLAYASPFTSSMNSLSSADSSCPISPKSHARAYEAATFPAPSAPADADLDLDSFFMDSSSDITAGAHLPAGFPHPSEGLPLDCGASDALLLEQLIAEGLDV